MYLNTIIYVNFFITFFFPVYNWRSIFHDNIMTKYVETHAIACVHVHIHVKSPAQMENCLSQCQYQSGNSTCQIGTSLTVITVLYLKWDVWHAAAIKKQKLLACEKNATAFRAVVKFCSTNRLFTNKILSISDKKNLICRCNFN